MLEQYWSTTGMRENKIPPWKEKPQAFICQRRSYLAVNVIKLFAPNKLERFFHGKPFMPGVKLARGLPPEGGN
jgi:hypothetical protein